MKLESCYTKLIPVSEYWTGANAHSISDWQTDASSEQDPCAPLTEAALLALMLENGVSVLLWHCPFTVEKHNHDIPNTYWEFRSYTSSSVILWKQPLTLGWCCFPAELPHWWGGRRGRGGGGGAVLWGATDRDGMGGPGEGDKGVSGEAAPQALSDHTKPPHPAHSPRCHISSFSLPVFFSRSLIPRVDFLLWWTDLCIPLLDSARSFDQCCGLNLCSPPKKNKTCMTQRVQRDGAAKDNKMKSRSKYMAVPSCVWPQKSKTEFQPRIFKCCLQDLNEL